MGDKCENCGWVNIWSEHVRNATTPYAFMVARESEIENEWITRDLYQEEEAEIMEHKAENAPKPRKAAWRYGVFIGFIFSFLAFLGTRGSSSPVELFFDGIINFAFWSLLATAVVAVIQKILIALGRSE